MLSRDIRLRNSAVGATFEGGNSYFENSTAQPLGGLARVLRGFFLSVRPGVNHILDQH